MPMTDGGCGSLTLCVVPGQRFALRRSARRAVRRDTVVTAESAWCSAFAVRVDGSRRSAISARRCTSARVSGTAMASNSHIRRRLEKNAHMLRVPSSSPRGSQRYPPCPGLSTSRAASPWTAITRSNHTVRHQASRHGRAWAGSTAVRKAVAPNRLSSISLRSGTSPGTIKHSAFLSHTRQDSYSAATSSHDPMRAGPHSLLSPVAGRSG